MEIITRNVSIVNKKGARTLGFIEGFILADTIFLYSLEGKGFLKEMDIPTILDFKKRLEISRVEFVMEPIVYKILSQRGITGLYIVRKLKSYGIDLLWISLDLTGL